MKRISTFFVATVISVACFSQTPVINYQQLTDALSAPVDIAHPTDGTGRLFIVQQGGLIRIWNGSSLVATPFLDVSAALAKSDEQGLLSMAFHPQYATNRYFFIYYTKVNDGSLTIARYRTQEGNPNLADASSGVEILNIPHPGNTNHNGGKLNFGSDGYLYLGTGDGGGSNDVPNNAQNGQSLLGKMLRIDVNDFNDVTPPLYSIPATNPYTSDAAAADEIIALGLRNPFRWSFDRQTGDMWIGDVGQGAREEVDFRSAANLSSRTNYGWRCMEGKIPNPSGTAVCPAPPDNVLPIFDYDRSAAGGTVITGGMVYRGTEFPTLNGHYICTDFASGNIWLIKSDGATGWTVTPQTTNLTRAIAGFGEDQSGNLYAVQLANGTGQGVLYKIITDNVLPLKLLSFTGSAQNNQHILNWTIAGSTPGDQFELESSTNNQSFTKASNYISASSGQSTYTSSVLATNTRTTYYRLKLRGSDGQISYSPVIIIQPGNTAGPAFKATVSGDFVTLELLQKAEHISIVNTAGQVLLQRTINNAAGVITIPLSGIATKGLLLIRVMGNGKNSTQKILY